MSELLAKQFQAFWVEEVPPGTINGTNTVFTLSFTTVNVSTISVYVDGIVCLPTVDYSFSGVTLTLTLAPVLGQKVFVTYIKK